MIRLNEIQNKLKEIEDGKFQKICDQILMKQGYMPYKFTGSVVGKDKTRPGTPDSVYVEKDGHYIYVEMTTQEKNLYEKIKKDIEKCLKKINESEFLKGKISKILFFHNSPNIDEDKCEKIKKICQPIELEIYGIDSLSKFLYNDYPQIAITELNIKDDVQTITKLSDESIEQLAATMSAKTSETISSIKERIKKLYLDAAAIVNTSDAIIYVSLEDKNKLKEISEQLKAFDFYYKNSSTEETILYYHNLCVIISKYSVEEGIRFYNNMPKDIKENERITSFYASLLIAKKDFEKAKDIIEKLYFYANNNDYFDDLIRVYYLLGMYNEVIKLLQDKPKEMFDEHGFLATMYLFSKNHIKKLNENEILKYNTGKFNKMPLFYACSSFLLYLINDKSPKIVKQFKKGISLIKSENSLVVSMMCDYSINIKLEKMMIDKLLKMNLTNLLERDLLKLLSITNENVVVSDSYIQDLLCKHNDLEIDANYLNAKILQNKGKEIESIALYKKSFDLNNKKETLVNIIKLSIKNRVPLEEKYILQLKITNLFDSLFLCSEAYDYLGKNSLALECSKKAIYTAKNPIEKNKALYQFWSVSMFKDNDEKEPSITKSGTTVVLNSDFNEQIFILEDDDYFKQGTKLLYAEIIRTNSKTGLNLLHKMVNDEVVLNGIVYTIKEILYVNTFICRAAFSLIKANKNTKMFLSHETDDGRMFDDLKNEMKKYNESVNQRLDFYQENINVPLSKLLTNKNEFEEYTQLINTLLYSNERLLYAGEMRDVSIDEGFVIDHTSLIIMTIFGILEIFNEIKNKVYITKSLYNKFNYFYEKMLSEIEEKEKRLYIVDGDKLLLNETLVLDKIKFWKELKLLLDDFNIVDYEFEKDDFLDNKTIGILDKVQFDLLGLSKEKNIPFICDDLMIRKICNRYGVIHTNSIYLIKKNKSDFKNYLCNLKKYLESNYIFAIDLNELIYISRWLFRNLNDQNKEDYLSIIKVMVSNKQRAKHYMPILITLFSSLEKKQFFEINGEIYENLFVSFYIEEVGKLIIETNDKFDLKMLEENVQDN